MERKGRDDSSCQYFMAFFNVLKFGVFLTWIAIPLFSRRTEMQLKFFHMVNNWLKLIHLPQLVVIPEVFLASIDRMRRNWLVTVLTKPKKAKSA